MNIPPTVRIGPWVFKVVRDDALLQRISERVSPRQSTAMIEAELGLIILREDRPESGHTNPSEDSLAISLLHEVLHGCLFAANADQDQEEIEELVTALSMGLLPVLRNNPGLVDFLVGTQHCNTSEPILPGEPFWNEPTAG